MSSRAPDRARYRSNAEQLAAPRLILLGRDALAVHGHADDTEALAQRISPGASLAEAVAGAEPT